MVRLRLELADCALKLIRACFNPTMVRLRHALHLRNEILDLKFQSHYGAIATYLMHPTSTCQTRRFNPTMVRLRLTMAGELVSSINFNPTMVRLRLSRNSVGSG